MLRERLSKQAPAPSSLKRMPLKGIASVVNSQKSQDEQTKLVQKLKGDNALLSEQADLLATELSGANKLVADRDAAIASLGKELSSCIEKARSRELFIHISKRGYYLTSVILIFDRQS